MYLALYLKQGGIFGYIDLPSFLLPITTKNSSALVLLSLHPGIKRELSLKLDSDHKRISFYKKNLLLIEIRKG